MVEPSKFGWVDEKNYALFYYIGFDGLDFLFTVNYLCFDQHHQAKRSHSEDLRAENCLSSGGGALKFDQLQFFSDCLFCHYRLTPIGLSPINVMVIPVIGMVSLLSIGGALIMATLNVFFRDFLHLTEVILRPMFYLTPHSLPPGAIRWRKLSFSFSSTLPIIQS